MEIFVELKLFATLEQYRPENADQYPITAGSSVYDLLDLLSIPKSAVKLVYINRARAELDTILKGGERIGLFPPIGGG